MMVQFEHIPPKQISIDLNPKTEYVQWSLQKHILTWQFWDLCDLIAIIMHYSFSHLNYTRDRMLNTSSAAKGALF